LARERKLSFALSSGLTTSAGIGFPTLESVGYGSHAGYADDPLSVAPAAGRLDRRRLGGNV